MYVAFFYRFVLYALKIHYTLYLISKLLKNDQINLNNLYKLLNVIIKKTKHLFQIFL